MNENNMFIEATRRKLRFNTTKGQLSVEELWDLNLTTLDNLAKGANKLVKAAEEESFIPSSRKRKNTEAELSLEILKYIIQVKVDEDNKNKERAEKQQKAARLKELLMQKKDSELASKSVEEIEKMLAELSAD